MILIQKYLYVYISSFQNFLIYKVMRTVFNGFYSTRKIDRILCKKQLKMRMISLLLHKERLEAREEDWKTVHYGGVKQIQKTSR